MRFLVAFRWRRHCRRRGPLREAVVLPLCERTSIFCASRRMQPVPHLWPRGHVLARASFVVTLLRKHLWPRGHVLAFVYST